MTVRVLFVCMGNICRSPTAHAVFREAVNRAGLAAHIEIDSAGTHAYHIGNPPDPRSTDTALGHGVDMTDLRARQVQAADFQRFDFLIAMDANNLALLRGACPESAQARLHLMLEWASDWGTEVPDPYYGGDAGFEQVFEMLTEACDNLLAHIMTTLLTAQSDGQTPVGSPRS